VYTAPAPGTLTLTVPFFTQAESFELYGSGRWT
jgi:hypothetical protein